MPRLHSNVPGNDANPDLRLLRLVESFEDGWVAGSPTSLEDWLATAGDDDRDELLRHGLAVEVAHRRLRGEAPTAGDYLGRFPHRSSIIHEALAETPPRSDPGPAGESWPPPGGTVLESLARSAGPMPRVLLSDARNDAEAPVVQPSSPELPVPATRPARVQLLGEIARGAMGAVLKGCDPDLGRDLAVKVLLEEHRHRPDLIRRFVEEAQIAGQLQHPGIVPVYELGVFGDARPYFTMRLVRGQTLAGLLAARPAPSSELPRFLETFVRVAQTVAYAHARGVVHRDLKPSNIMVGPFGEVQVMDWGLAKILPRAGADDDREVGDGNEQEAVVATTRSDSAVDRSRAGSVLGTPSYMAPEQADGQVEWVDERADVFALGSILCEILTGRPAFTGPSSDDVLRSARRADLAGAFARLESCGADDELVRLARDCLAPALGDRLRDAQAVADRMQAYLDGVHRRIREAELARAAEAARAEEARATAAAAEGRARAERRARRMTAGLAATVLIATALGIAGWRWVELDRIRRTGLISARVNAALQEATRLRGQAQKAAVGDLTPWVEALAAADKAGGLLEPGSDPALKTQVASLLAEIAADKGAAEAAVRSEKADQLLVDQMDDIRSSKADDFDSWRIDAEYARAFREAGIDIAGLSAAEAGGRVKARPAAVAAALTAALDNWASVRRSLRHDRPGARLLTEAANAADPDPWRVGLRRALDLADRPARGKALQTLAASAHRETMPAVDLDLLGTALAEVEQFEAAEAVLRAGQRRFPDSIWLNYDLARLLAARSRDQEAIRYYSVARTLRPKTALALALLLADVGESDEAVAVFGDLLQQQPGDSCNWACYGRLLGERDDRAGSAAALEKSVALAREDIRLRPDDAHAHSNLGLALGFQGKQAEAVDAFRNAIRLEPNVASHHVNLGVALNRLRSNSDEVIAPLRSATRLQRDARSAPIDRDAALQVRRETAEAMAAFRTAIRLQPDDARGHFNLGLALRLQGDLPEAIAAFRTAIRLQPESAQPHAALGYTLQLQGEPAAAAGEYRTAIRLDPDDMGAHTNLGYILSDVQHDYDGAIAEFSTAIRLRPDEARAHLGLGLALGRQGKLEEATAAFRTAIRLRPDDPDAHVNLGLALRVRGESAEAAAAYRTAIRLRPDDVGSHINLGAILTDFERDYDGAIAEFRAAIRLRPDEPEAYTGLGLALGHQGKLEEAAASFRAAIRLRPDHARAHFNLGLALQGRGELAEAEGEFRAVLRVEPRNAEAHCSLGRMLSAQGQFEEALAELRIGHRLGSSRPGWGYPSAQWVRDAEGAMVLARRLPAVLEGDDTPRDSTEWLEFARICSARRRHAAATRLYVEALRAEPRLADDQRARHTYAAACNAAVAGCGQGKDVPRPDEAARAKLRGQALEWLRGELRTWSRTLDQWQPEGRATARQVLEHWKTDPALACLREPARIAELPEGERSAWRALWGDVDTLLKKARGDHP
jgi:eukaryotic-like serine/threonine-protein kinase